MKFLKYKCEFKNKIVLKNTKYFVFFNKSNFEIKTKYGKIKYSSKDKKCLIIENFKSKKIFLKIFKIFKKSFKVYSINYQSKIKIDNSIFFKLVDYDYSNNNFIKKYSNLFFNKTQIEFCVLLNKIDEKYFIINKDKTEIGYNSEESRSFLKLYKSGQLKIKSKSLDSFNESKKIFLKFYNSFFQ